MSKSIQHNLFYQQPPSIVWEYIADAELMALWLMPNDFKPELGHEFTFRTNPMPNFNFDGIIYCKVLEIDPPKKLVYSWKGGPGNGEITMDSVVEFTLVEKDNGTEMQLVHSGIKGFEKLPIYTLMDAGWLKNMKKIDELINAK